MSGEWWDEASRWRGTLRRERIVDREGTADDERELVAGDLDLSEHAAPGVWRGTLAGEARVQGPRGERRTSRHGRFSVEAELLFEDGKVELRLPDDVVVEGARVPLSGLWIENLSRAFRRYALAAPARPESLYRIHSIPDEDGVEHREQFILWPEDLPVLVPATLPTGWLVPPGGFSKRAPYPFEDPTSVPPSKPPGNDTPAPKPPPPPPPKPPMPKPKRAAVEALAVDDAVAEPPPEQVDHEPPTGILWIDSPDAERVHMFGTCPALANAPDVAVEHSSSPRDLAELAGLDRSLCEICSEMLAASYGTRLLLSTSHVGSSLRVWTNWLEVAWSGVLGIGAGMRSVPMVDVLDVRCVDPLLTHSAIDLEFPGDEQRVSFDSAEERDRAYEIIQARRAVG